MCTMISTGHVITGMQKGYSPGAITTGCKEVIKTTRNVTMLRTNVLTTGNEVTLRKIMISDLTTGDKVIPARLSKTMASGLTTGHKAGIVSLHNKTAMSKAVTVSRHNQTTVRAADKATMVSLRNSPGVVIASLQTKPAAATIATAAVASTTPKIVRKADILPAA